MVHRYFKLGGGLILGAAVAGAASPFLLKQNDDTLMMTSYLIERLAMAAVFIGVIAIAIALWEGRRLQPKPRTYSAFSSEVDITKSEAFRQFLRRDPAVKRMPVADQRRLFAEYRAARGGEEQAGDAKDS